MNKEQGKLVTQNFHDIMATQGEFLSETVYKNFFLLAPSSQELFAQTDMKTQFSMLLVALSMIIKSIDDPSYVKTLQGLGDRHKGYGVKLQDYFSFGEALIMTIAEFSKPNWTDELEAAWEAFFKELLAVMLNDETSLPIGES